VSKRRALSVIACAVLSLGYGLASPSVAGMVTGRAFLAARGPYMDYAPLSALPLIEEMFRAEVQPVLATNGATAAHTSIMETRVFGHHMMEGDSADSLATPRFQSVMNIYRLGVPFLSGESTQWYVVDRTAPNLVTYGGRGQRGRIAIPVPFLGPVPLLLFPDLIWRGVILNALSFAAIYSVVVWGVPWVRRRILSLRGRCIRCGYTTQSEGVCPECGLGDVAPA
jgi:hypothetical protein